MKEMKECIGFSVRKNKVVIKIKENAQYDEIVKELSKKMTDLKKKHENKEIPISVEGRNFTSKEMTEIKDII